jgi:hypothetical protein
MAIAFILYLMIGGLVGFQLVSKSVGHICRKGDWTFVIGCGLAAILLWPVVVVGFWLED